MMGSVKKSVNKNGCVKFLQSVHLVCLRWIEIGAAGPRGPSSGGLKIGGRQLVMYKAIFEL